MKLAQGITAAFLLSCSSLGGEGTNDHLVTVRSHLKMALAKEEEKIEMLLDGSLREQKLPFEERIPGTEKIVERACTADIDHYEFKANGETTFVTIYRFQSIDDSTAAMNRFISQMPVQPPISIAGIGDAAVRFPGRTRETTGSFLFQRGMILIQINGKTTVFVEMIARLIDQSVLSAKIQ